MSHKKRDSTSHNLFVIPDRVNTGSRQGDNQLFIHEYHSVAGAQELMTTALALVNPRGKGIYASDESPDVMTAILNTVKDDGNEEQTFSAEEDKEKRKKWKEFAYDAIQSGQYFKNKYIQKEL